MTPDAAHAHLDAWIEAHPDATIGLPPRDPQTGPAIGLVAPEGTGDFHAYTLAVAALESLDGALSGRARLVLDQSDLAGCAFVLCAGSPREIVSAYGGSLQMEVTLRGRAGPAAFPDEAVDALEAAVGVLGVLYQRNGAYGRVRSKVPGIEGPRINVARLAGGAEAGVVPGEAAFLLERRMMPEERPEVVEREMRVTLQSAAAAFPAVEVEARIVALVAPFKPQDGNAPLVDALRRHGLAVFGRELPERGTPEVADARLRGEGGLPPVLFGAGADAEPANRLGTAKVLARTLFDLLRTG